MKLKCCLVILLITFFTITFCVKAQTRLDENWRDVEPKVMTLFSRTKHKAEPDNYGKSIFSFKYGKRGDVKRGGLENNHDLSYCHLLMDDECWFSVQGGKNDFSQIKDLDELNWSDVFNVPYLPANIEHNDGILLDYKTKNFEESSSGQVTKATVGHLYVLHTKNEESDFYTLLRVEKLVEGDKITISWKSVPSPEQ